MQNTSTARSSLLVLGGILGVVGCGNAAPKTSTSPKEYDSAQPVPTRNTTSPQLKKAPLASVEALIKRVTPQVASQFRVEPLTSPSKTEGFEIRSVGGKVVLRGNTPVAQASAYGWYLKHVANVHLSWNGDQLRLPARLPAPANPIAISTPYQKRFAFNYCTLSYTSAFWDWERWQREIDFLAQSGFNQVLVTAGMEKVWQQTLRELGYPETKIRQFIASPTYAAWWNMGNIEGLGGPMSDAQIENEVKLGQQITKRMRELGITPVLTGFVGLLPNDIGDYRPDFKPDLLPQGTWDDFQRPIVLKPTSPHFSKVAAIWYKNLHAVYGGPTSVYGGDLFHEGGRRGDTPLGEAAKDVQTAMQAASPGSTWVLQGWQNNPLPQLLEGLDPQKTQVLQLCRDLRNGNDGSSLRTYDGIPWLWCELANFGGKNGLFGGVPFMSKLPGFLLNPANKRGNLQGVGLLSEATEQNPLYYDLFFDTMWRRQDIDVNAWLDDYARRRYGSANPTARKAIGQLMESGIYSPEQMQNGPTESILFAKPAPAPTKVYANSLGKLYYDKTKIADAAETLLQAAPQLKNQETYRYDLLDWTRQVVVELARPTLEKAMDAYNRKDLNAFNQYAEQYLGLLRDCDRLLASDKYWLLGNWIAQARAKGTTPAEKARMEESARTLITTWSGRVDQLNDYSHRHWAGLTRDYYLPRWQAFFEDYRAVLEGRLPKSALDNWYKTRRATTDIAFAKATKTYSTQPQGDTVAIARELLAKYAPLTREYARLEAQNKPYTWKLAKGLTEFSFDVGENMDQAGTYQATFQWKSGNSALKIHSVALYEGDKKIAEDVHEGWTGNENRQNSYQLEVPQLINGLESYTLRAQVSGASSTSSSGVLQFVKSAKP